MLAGVQVFCFAASYTVAFVLEVSRLFFRAPVRWAVMMGFALAGMLAHSLYLFFEAQQGLSRGAPLSSWYHWCLLAAWLLVTFYVALALQKPQDAIGLFMLPIILSLIGVAVLLRSWQGVAPFPRDRALVYWGVAHGFALLAGAVVVALGFVAGLMYLAQSYRLKHKLPPRRGFRLPSLEWLQGMNERALIISSVLVAAGLIAGLILNLIKHTGVPWTDPVVWTSGVLLLWLIAALLFNALYKPARQGRKVAYLTVASFVFLGMELAIVLFAPSAHATPKGEAFPRRPGLPLVGTGAGAQAPLAAVAPAQDATSDPVSRPNALTCDASRQAMGRALNRECRA